MANNTVQIEFVPCQPAPINGYRVRYRPIGSSIPYRVWPENFLTSPAIFTDTNDPDGTSYDGFIQGDCGGDQFGVPVVFIANNPEDESASAPPDDSGSVSVSGSLPDNVHVIHLAGTNNKIQLIGQDDGFGGVTDIFTVLSGNWPLSSGETIRGNHAGYTGPVVVNYSVGLGVIVRFFINGVMVHCSAISGPGGGTGTLWTMMVLAPSDILLIEQSTTPC